MSHQDDVFAALPRGETTSNRRGGGGRNSNSSPEVSVSEVVEELGNVLLRGVNNLLGEPLINTNRRANSNNNNYTTNNPSPRVPPPGPNSGYLFDSADQLPNHNATYSRPSFYDVPVQPLPYTAGARGPTMKAVIVGCNYPNSPQDMQLCASVSDALNWAHVLEHHFGFGAENIACLLDVDSYGQPVLFEDETFPSRENITDNLDWLVEDSQPGDVRVFIFAGFGTQIRDEENDFDQPLAEGILPTDWEEDDSFRGFDRKIITQDELHLKFQLLPAGANLTLIMDCAHSNNMLNVVKKLDATDPRSIDFVNTHKSSLNWRTESDAGREFDRGAWENNPESSRCLPRRAVCEPERNQWRKYYEKMQSILKPSDSLDPNLIAFNFAACREDQTAVEMRAGEPSGLLSHCLLTALARLHYNCTYHQLFAEAALVANDVKVKLLPAADARLQLAFSDNSDPANVNFLDGCSPQQAEQFKQQTTRRGNRGKTPLNLLCKAMCSEIDAQLNAGEVTVRRAGGAAVN